MLSALDHAVRGCAALSRLFCVALWFVAVHAAAAQDRAPPAGVVNLNTASAEQLDRLPGIGPSRARAIIELRTKLSGFKHIEDVLRVRGIGRATFRKLRPLLTLQGPTTLSALRSEGLPGAARCSAASA